MKNFRNYIFIFLYFYIFFPVFSQKYAVLIGIDNYKSHNKIFDKNVLNVDLFEKDVAFKMGIPKKNIFIFKNQKADYFNLETFFKNKLSELTYHDEVFIYFNGMGTAILNEGEYERCIIPYSDGNNYISETNLRDWLSYCLAYRVLFLDTQFFKTKKSLNSKNITLPEFKSGISEIVYSSENFFNKDLNLAEIFSLVFKNGDSNKDKKISAVEADNYINRYVSNTYKIEPKIYYNSKYEKQFVLSDLSKGKINFISKKFNNVEIYLNDKFYGKTPVSIEVEPSIYSFRANCGDKQFEKQIRINSGFNKDISINFDINKYLIQGKVLDKNYFPVKNAKVSIINNEDYYDITSINGKFAIEVPIGNYEGIFVVQQFFENKKIAMNLNVENKNISIPNVYLKKNTSEFKENYKSQINSVQILVQSKEFKSNNFRLMVENNLITELIKNNIKVISNKNLLSFVGVDVLEVNDNLLSTLNSDYLINVNLKYNDLGKDMYNVFDKGESNIEFQLISKAGKILLTGSEHNISANVSSNSAIKKSIEKNCLKISEKIKKFFEQN